jgi:hypothetical protein
MSRVRIYIVTLKPNPLRPISLFRAFFDFRERSTVLDLAITSTVQYFGYVQTDQSTARTSYRRVL